MRFFYLVILALLSTIPSAYADVHQYFTKIKTNPNALYAFFKSMPKGGELHYHLAGGAYPETMLELSTAHPYCLNTKNFTISKSAETCSGILSHQIFQEPSLYQNIIRAWSMKDFLPGTESGHDHFFSSFYKFMAIVSDFRPQLLAEVIKRAAEQHELYMEIMLLPDDARATTFGTMLKELPSFTEKRKALLASTAFQKNVTYSVEESRRILTEARKQLQCDDKPTQPSCQLTVKFQYYILREQPFDNLFSQAVAAFEIASRSSDIVGINLVQAEDGIISLRDYHQHMKLIGFLHKIYPEVHIALHAGELAFTDVAPKHLRSHIKEAIMTGHAERIGHGVSIAFETDASQLVQQMASKPIPVEINLTSNEKILNVQGKAHPLNYYIQHHVPVVLSTDDEGILRTDLTREYVRAAIEHQLDYDTLKMINRNALTYSFLPGQSLWRQASTATPVKVCTEMNSHDCLRFIDKNPKARLQWQLEKQLNQFERKFSERNN